MNKNWEKFTKNQENLPQDAVLADLYAFSRSIKKGEHLADDVSAKAHYFNTLAQLSFITKGCQLGQCSFCSYGARTNDITPAEVDSDMQNFAKQIHIMNATKRSMDEENPQIQALLFDAVGSIFDENEFASECLDKLFENLDIITAQNQIRSITFETHVKTLYKIDENGQYVCSNALQKMLNFKATHPAVKSFTIELGFESADPEIRDNLIFKPLDDVAYKTMINFLQTQGVSVQLNVMATLPFLTQQEQILSSAKSVVSALESQENGGYGANSVVLFPLNIRPNTFYQHTLQVAKQWTRDSGQPMPTWLKYENPIWSMIATLDAINRTNPALLDRVSIAWYGGRSVYDEDEFPRDWDKITQALDTYKAGLNGKNSRQNIISTLTQHTTYQEFLTHTKAEEQPNTNLYNRAEILHTILEQSSPLLATSDINIISPPELQHSASQSQYK